MRTKSRTTTWPTSRSTVGSLSLVTRRTKIIATIGPSSEDDSTLKAMIAAGMDVARINMSHGSIEEGVERFHKIRAASKAMGQPVGILVDLPGPKVRLSKFAAPLLVANGDEVLLAPGDEPSTEKKIFVKYESLLTDIHVGDRLGIGDGAIMLDVTSHEGDHLVARVDGGGIVQGSPGFHIPSDRLRISTPTTEDLRILDAFVELGVDFVAVSFVRSAHDIRRLGIEPAPRGPLVVAKIETRAAVANLDGIIDACGAVMVARGDLGLEMSIAELPHLQKDIISRCIALGRPAITATQMLESMIDAPAPTRAEASDVANAVFDGTSVVMLSGETAVGNDPANVVETMAALAERADERFDYEGWALHIKRDRLSEPQGLDSAVTDTMTMATWRAATELGAKAIICISRSGFTVRAIARFRPEVPIIGVTPEPRTFGQLTMSWGARPMMIDRIENNVETVRTAVDLAKREGHVRTGDLVAVLGGSTATIGATDTLRVVRVP